MSDDLNFNSIFGDENIDFECPNCKETFQITLNNAGETITCPNCSTSIQLTKSDDYDSIKSNIDEALSDLNNLFD